MSIKKKKQNRNCYGCPTTTHCLFIIGFLVPSRTNQQFIIIGAHPVYVSIQVLVKNILKSDISLKTMNCSITVVEAAVSTFLTSNIGAIL